MRCVITLRLNDLIRDGTLAMDEAQQHFLFDFGSHLKVCGFVADKLTISRIPPEPDKPPPCPLPIDDETLYSYAAIPPIRARR